MFLSNNGLKLLQKYEGWSSKPYVDPASGGLPITIGYGNTFYEDGSKVKLTDLPITKERGLELLKMTLLSFELIVAKKVKININQNQFDALVLHTYNTGGSDTLFKMINNKEDVKTWWTTKYITGGGKPLAGLKSRRLEEYNLFIK